MNILITGSAGFIGFHLAKLLLQNGHIVVGVDNINDYYDQNLKTSRLNILKQNQNFTFMKIDIADFSCLKEVFQQFSFSVVCNLAAQAGVRYCLENPLEYIRSNVVGFTNILELSRQNDISHFLYASSSSVYGLNTKMPFQESHSCEHPVSLYGATKKSNEIIAHSYSSMYNLPTTGLRFFTVYGPWGRPDMALFNFTNKILNSEPIEIYNYGDMQRDFTYIDDIVQSIQILIDKPPQPDDKFDQNNPNPGTSISPFKVYNIGNDQPVRLLEFMAHLEKCLNKKAIMNFLPLQTGDVKNTFSDSAQLASITKFKPNTPIQVGIENFVNWYLKWYEKQDAEEGLNTII